MSQVLEQRTGVSPTTYRDGHKRLAGVQGGTHTWYGTDALGSVRQTLTGGGTATAALHYDPWGTPTEGTTPTFGFTGAWQAAASGLVHLRARWYLPGHATFVSRDPFAGFPTAPASLHPYLYVGNNPVNLSDPSGRCYPPFARLRAIEPMNCRNLDQAIEIAEHPNATWQHRAAANTYIVAFWGSHGGLVAGLAGAGVGYFGSVGVVAGGQAFLATHPLMSAALAVGGAIGAIAGTGYTAYQAMICGDPYAQTALANPGVYGAPLMWQELSSALVSARQGLSTIGQRATGWWHSLRAPRIPRADELTLSGTVEKHLWPIVKHRDYKGERVRPFGDSRILMQGIMDAQPPIPDPQGHPGFLRWDVPGSFRGSDGVWELVIDPKTKTVFHFNFTSGK